MKLLALKDGAIALSAAVLLAGCGGSQPSISTPGAMSQLGVHKRSGSSGDLLYTSNYSSARGLAVFTFPQGQFVTDISNVGVLNGICSDQSGNVFAVMIVNGYAGTIYEFAHGGTMPIAQIGIPNNKFSTDCAVDPKTGDLAAIQDGGYGDSLINVWQLNNGQYSQPPSQYSMSAIPWALTYDGSGNLFVIGSAYKQDFVLQKLPFGGSELNSISFGKPVGWPGGIKWDGKVLVLLTGDRSLSPRAYQFKVKGSTAKVVKTLHFAQIDKQPYNIWIEGGTWSPESLARANIRSQ